MERNTLIIPMQIQAEDHHKCEQQLIRAICKHETTYTIDAHSKLIPNIRDFTLFIKGVRPLFSTPL